MKSFNRINTLTGWGIFLIAAAVYILTMEPTASFWDCGEFIAVSYKLMVPHPPGAPLFLLIGRMFSLLAGDDVTQVAYWVNMVSALSSAFTILFLFWTITLIARKLVVYDVEKGPSLGQIIAILGSGAIGALAYTFSDSFWFSAVEAEVYAISSFFTAFVFWAMLKWETVADEPSSDRWLILIAYMMGLSIGVHLLNLLTIPALAFIFYFRKYKPTWSGGIIAFLISAVIIMIILVGIIPGLPSMAGWFEVIFVNSFGFPFNSGSIFFVAILIGSIVYGVIYSIKHQNRLMNVALISLIFILIGYASYGIVLIRSTYDPPIDENDPEDVIKFISYLKREQYGDRPLLYGPQFTAELVSQEEGDPLYRKTENGYEVYDYKLVNGFDPKHETLLPRMHSKQPHHVAEYKRLLRSYGGYREGKMPSGSHNIRYMFDHQLGWMYWRYFKWNFVGRAGDIQDSPELWPWQAGEELPELLQSKARNNFWALPFILGLFGLFFHTVRDNKYGFIVAVLFFFTGIAIILYLNAPPIEPRERDYAYAGSFYAFAIWIGLGVLGLYDLLVKYIKNSTITAGIATILAAIVPFVMAAEGWDDHDRSQRYHSVDSAKNLLSSCAPNAIVFTGGDNDTFPLWYVQEVEGFRTDVRVCNLSLLNTDWYIDQMRRQAYESAPLPISFEEEQYLSGTNDYVQYYNPKEVDKEMHLDKYIEAVRTGNRAISMRRGNKTISILPSKSFILDVDRDQVLANNVVPEQYKRNVSNRMEWKHEGGALEKKDLMILDMIANINKDGWKRPIYFSTTLAPSNYLNLKDHMFLEGLAYRLLPAKHGDKQGVVNTDVMFENMMNKFAWRGMDKSNVFYDENYHRFAFNARLQYYMLAAHLLYVEKDKERSKKVVEHCLSVLPDHTIPYDPYSAQFVGLLFELGEDEKALEMSKIMGDRAIDLLSYLRKNTLRDDTFVYRQKAVLSMISRALDENGHKEEARVYMNMLQ